MEYKLEVQNKEGVINSIYELLKAESIVVLTADLRIKRPEITEMSSSDGWRTYYINKSGSISIKSGAKLSICEAGRYSVFIVLFNQTNDKLVWGAK